MNKADKRLRFRHIHSTTPLLQKLEISTLQLSVIVVPLKLDLVGNPKDRFCHDAVYLILQRFQVILLTQMTNSGLVKSREMDEMAHKYLYDQIEMKNCSKQCLSDNPAW